MGWPVPRPRYARQSVGLRAAKFRTPARALPSSFSARPTKARAGGPRLCPLGSSHSLPSPAHRPRPATPSVTGKVVLQLFACADLWHRDRASHSARSTSAVGVLAALRAGSAATRLAKVRAPMPTRSTNASGTVGLVLLVG